MLSKRRRIILNNLIENYVVTGEPTGSSRLVKKYGIEASPATVRNELAALEEMGYLEQPHTSAGRVPTDKGYRFYVSSLTQDTGLSETEKIAVHRFYSELSKEVEGLLRETCDLLSNITHYVAIAFAAPPRKSSIKHLDLVWLGSNTVLLVLITDTGRVGKRIIEFKQTVASEVLGKVEKSLNQKISGKNIDEVPQETEEEMAELFHPGGRILTEKILEQIVDCLTEEEGERAYLGGTTNILDYSQFAELTEIQELFKAFEQKYFLLGLLKEALAAPPVVVKIGSENKQQEMKHCSFIGTSYRVEGKSVGTVGILGPTRMNYPRAISAVEYIARNLSETLDSSS